MAIRIMVVDDEPAIGKLLLHQLSGFGYQVSYIQDGIAALQRLRWGRLLPNRRRRGCKRWTWC